MTWRLYPLALLAGCGPRIPAPYPLPDPGPDPFNIVSVVEYGGALFAALGLLCILAGIVLAIWFGKVRMGPITAATGIGLILGGALLQQLGNNLFWLVPLCVVLCVGAVAAYIYINHERIIDSAEDALGIDHE